MGKHTNTGMKIKYLLHIRLAVSIIRHLIDIDVNNNTLQLKFMISKSLMFYMLAEHLFKSQSISKRDNYVTECVKMQRA